MPAVMQRSRFLRWLRWAGFATLGFILLAGAAFWRWPLHVQAHVRLLGDILEESRPPDEGVKETESPYRPPPPPETQDYFPERTFYSGDGPYSWTFRTELMLAEQMREFGESSIYKRRTDASTHVYRFTWNRTFHPAIVVRLEVEADGTARIISKHCTMIDVDKYKVRQGEKKLSRRRTSKFIEQFERSNFWSSPAEGSGGGIDGAMWLFEGCRDGRYHVVEHWSPENGDPFKSLGLNLLETAGFWRGPVY